MAMVNEMKSSAIINEESSEKITTRYISQCTPAHANMILNTRNTRDSCDILRVNNKSMVYCHCTAASVVKKVMKQTTERFDTNDASYNVPRIEDEMQYITGI